MTLRFSHRRLPPEDEPILPWHGGYYARGFVALHPFFAIPGMDPSDCEYGTLIIERSDIPAGKDLMAWGDRMGEARRKGKLFDHDAVDEAAKRHGRSIGWRAICDHAAFADQCALHRALGTHIRRFRPEYADEEGARRLTAHCAAAGVFLPTENFFQPIMQNALLSLFEACGFERIVFADEFGLDEKTVDMADLPKEAPWPGVVPFGDRRLLSEDGSLFVETPWDNFYTVILGTAERLESARPERLFEGFWCDDRTIADWHRQPPLPLVDHDAAASPLRQEK